MMAKIGCSRKERDRLTVYHNYVDGALELALASIETENWTELLEAALALSYKRPEPPILKRPLCGAVRTSNIAQAREALRTRQWDELLRVAMILEASQASSSQLPHD